MGLVAKEKVQIELQTILCIKKLSEQHLHYTQFTQLIRWCSLIDFLNSRSFHSKLLCSL